MAGERVLIIEDNPVNMELEADVLGAYGFEVLQAPDAYAGLELAETQAPDIILMDVRLPGMDGISAVRRLKANPATAAIPIVAVSAQAMRGDEAQALRAGCVGYITKPIDTRQFPKAIARFLCGAECG